MINFGVREVANSKTAPAPGWAYIPDTGVNASVAALQPSSRKRARNQTVASSHETTARQDAKILRELASLDRENAKDVSIPVPIRHRDNAGRVSHGKVTPGVRKILQSQKTFANYLSDFEALAQNPSAAPAPSQSVSTPIRAPVPRAAPGTAVPHLTSKGTRSHKKKVPNAVATPTPLRRVSSVSAPIPVKAEPSTKDTPMPDAPVLSQGSSTLPIPHPGDKDALLVSRIPGIPSQADIEKLLAAPPLTYNEARGPWVQEDMRKPVKQFCEICGYWGRVRCMRCGGKVCALECLNTHQQDCFQRYGA
ncbi:hypothetical protein WAI453_012227 [Rhynchosporium graminicola]|uniref:Related to HIT finger domain protein n=1 Tax=Rhynchosporium graminicola TaxID=2792576 RepID=A0A1E1KXP7_9HELO|nr:related to HIT finger domain protein [Rhynchosporium commune]